MLILDIADIEKHYPGLLKATIEWFKIYKIPDGKPENNFAFNGEAKSRDFALNIVAEVHEHWKSLIKRDTPPTNISWYVKNCSRCFCTADNKAKISIICC